MSAQQGRRERDRRNRRWGSLKNAVELPRLKVSQKTKEILSALRDNGEQRISYGAVIEKLAAAAERLLG